MDIKKLVPGAIVWDVMRRRMGNTKLKTTVVFSVKIVSVDIEKRTVVASWNFNAPCKHPERAWRKWKATKPVLVGSAFGPKRLARKDEIAAMEAQAAR